LPNLKLLGFEQIPNTLEAPLSALSSTDAVAQEFIVDPTLPVVGRKYLAPFPEIVIPKFRIVSVKKTTRTTTGNPYLTLATSGTTSYVSPIGVTAADVWRSLPTMRGSDYQPTVWRNCYVRYPYLPAVTDANGTVSRGDLMVPDGYGRPVRFVENASICMPTVTVSDTTDLTSYASVYLTSAIYAGISPTNIVAWNVTQAEQETIVSSTYVTAASAWRLRFARLQVTPSTDNLLVFYNYGHSPKDVAGQLISLDVDYPTSDWIKWVGNNFGDFPAVPLSVPAPSTLVTLDGAGNGSSTYNPAASLVANSTNTVYTLTYKPISTCHSLTVYVNGTAEAKSSIPGLYAGELSGTNYVVDPISGTITFKTGYLTITDAVTATYYRITAYSLGTTAWPTGIYGITDQNTAPAGLGPGYPPEFVASMDGGAATVGGILWEVF
jgi:hypothetical protein